MNLRRLHWFTAALCGACLCAQAAEPAQTVVIEAVAPGEILYNYETGVGVITNDFVVRLKDATLSAHQGDFNEKTGQFRVEGDVFLQQDNQVWRGERLDYNYLTKKIGSDEFRAGRAPFYAAGEGLALDFTQKVYTATNAFVTSDDSYNPAYRVKTRRLTIAPGKYFEAQDAVVYLGSVPIFYFPYLRRNLDGPMNHVTVLPGYRSVWGAFLLGAYDWYWNDNLQGAVHLDYRTKRGVGAGLDVQYDLGQAGRGDAKFYYAHDLDPSAQIPEGDPVPGKNREMFFLVHRANPLTNLTANLVVRQLSDPYVTHDFFQNLYEENVQPSSFVEARRLWPDFSLNLLVQPQVNEFYQTVERLPSIHLTPARQQIGTTPLYYEGDNSVGYFEQAYAAGRYATTPPSNNYAAFRADTFHQVLLPQTLFGWLNVAPRVGGRFTFYGHENGEDADLSAVDRWVFTTGMEVNFKLSRLWPHATNSLFDALSASVAMLAAASATQQAEEAVAKAKAPKKSKAA